MPDSPPRISARVVPALAIFLLLGAVTTIAMSRPSHADEPVIVSVHIKDFAFVPSVITIAPGTTVTWTNDDEDPHTVVSTGKDFGSAALDTNARFSFTFVKPGDFAYFCSLHPHMTARITVRPS